ncbi:MAG: ankyrin repeat domain-containing protein, partial [Bacteroidales bacterium]|nr:ankyrin repeat domain-containing protein [Bacteroidales bacterium]
NLKDQFGRTPLHWTARGVHYEILKYLIEKGSDVNAIDGYSGVTALHSVSARGHAEAIELLLNSGADKEIQSKFVFCTPLHYAAVSDNIQAVKILIDKGADLFAKDVNEKTPLFYACEEGKVESVKLLLMKMGRIDSNAINNIDFDGNSVLHFAAENGQKEIAEILLENGAEINLLNTIGMTPYNMAISSGRSEVASLLAESGAHKIEPGLLPGGKYIDKNFPVMTPKLFAKGIISTQKGMHGTIVFSPSMDEVFWKSDGGFLQYMKREGERWSLPEEFRILEGYWIDSPCYSFDGRRLYFMAGEKNENGRIMKENIYYCERSGDGWSEPVLFEAPVNTVPMHFQFSFDRKGNFYTGGGDIYCSVFKDGEYANPEKLPSVINSAASETGPFISPEGDYIIFSQVTPPPDFSSKSMISLRDSSGSWTKPINLESVFGGDASMFRLSPDGKYLFFQSSRPGSPSNRGVYWVSSKIIDQLRPVKQSN